MAVKNGYDTCKDLKKFISQGLLKEMTILAHTADITNYNIQKCNESGFDKMIGKPILKD